MKTKKYGKNQVIRLWTGVSKGRVTLGVSFPVVLEDDAFHAFAALDAILTFKYKDRKVTLNKIK